MPEINIGVVCPHCGAEHQLGVTAIREATPEMVEAIKAVMAIERSSAMAQAKIRAQLGRVRYFWYVAAAGMIVAATFYGTGPEMISRWAAVVANLTGVMVALTCAFWCVDLKIWTARP